MTRLTSALPTRESGHHPYSDSESMHMKTRIFSFGALALATTIAALGTQAPLDGVAVRAQRMGEVHDQLPGAGRAQVGGVDAAELTVADAAQARAEPVDLAAAVRTLAAALDQGWKEGERRNVEDRLETADDPSGHLDALNLYRATLEVFETCLKTESPFAAGWAPVTPMR